MIILDDMYKTEMKEKNMNRMTKVIKYLVDNERSLSWLARKCDVSPAAAKYWIDGKHEPSEKHIKIIKEVIGL